MSYNFSNHVTRICINVCKYLESTEIANLEADGVGCNNSFLRGELCEFMLVKSFHVGLNDKNHNRKTNLYQLFGGAS